MTDHERARIFEAGRAEGWAIGYKQGVSDTERELVPFADIGRVRFRRELEWFDASVLYEGDVRGELLGLQRDVVFAEEDEEHAERAREHATSVRAHVRTRRPDRHELGRLEFVRTLWAWWWEHRDASLSVHDEDQRAAECRAAAEGRRTLASKHAQALRKVRDWLDEQIAGAPADSRARYARDRAGLRRSNRVTVDVRRVTSEEFFADPSHCDQSWPDDGGPPMPAGMDFGHEYTWELPERHGAKTLWAIFRLENGELYARHRPPFAGEHFSPGDDHGVMLLGSLPRSSETDDFLYELQCTVMRDGHNTLMAAAEAIAQQIAAVARRSRSLGDDR